MCIYRVLRYERHSIICVTALRRVRVNTHMYIHIHWTKNKQPARDQLKAAQHQRRWVVALATEIKSMEIYISSNMSIYRWMGWVGRSLMLSLRRTSSNAVYIASILALVRTSASSYSPHFYEWILFSMIPVVFVSSSRAQDALLIALCILLSVQHHSINGWRRQSTRYYYEHAMMRRGDTHSARSERKSKS